jgi:hypothetical protein
MKSGTTFVNFRPKLYSFLRNGVSDQHTHTGTESFIKVTFFTF